MTEEQKQKMKDYQREYHKKYYAAKNLIKKDNKIIKHVRSSTLITS